MTDRRGWDHQCRRPWLWLARLRGKRLGATWQCNCGKRWRIGAMKTHGVPGIGLIHEWQEMHDGDRMKRAAVAREKERQEKNRYKARARDAERRLSAAQVVYDKWMFRTVEECSDDAELILADVGAALDGEKL